MKSPDYKKQVQLLLSVLPLVAKEKCFALHGGTAINMFHSNMPRLSVDIDLTYLPVDNRVNSLTGINAALQRIASQIEESFPDTIAQHRQTDAKLIVSNKDAGIKVEANIIKRGCFSPPEMKLLCAEAQQEFDAFCDIQVVEKSHLFGGKICAALDRQHPRDLFDIQQLFKTQQFDDELKKGFIFYLVSSGRPVYEMLFPNLNDQKQAFENQFAGMTRHVFTYDDYTETRLLLIDKIHSSLTAADKQFLVSFEQGIPDWDLYDFSIFPAVQWKLLNIQHLKTQNPAKHQKMFKSFEERLFQGAEIGGQWSVVSSR
jgi:predicted nucleotidyltransferase component of viral defense system